MSKSASSPMFFEPMDFNKKVAKMESNGFEEYLTVLEPGEPGKPITHVIMKNTVPGSKYQNWVVDIWDNGRIEICKL